MFAAGFFASRFLLAIKHFIIINFMNSEFECRYSSTSLSVAGRVVKKFFISASHISSLLPQQVRRYVVNKYSFRVKLSHCCDWDTRHHVRIALSSPFARRNGENEFHFSCLFNRISSSCIAFAFVRGMDVRYDEWKILSSSLDVHVIHEREMGIGIELKIVSIKLEVNYCLPPLACFVFRGPLFFASK